MRRRHLAGPVIARLTAHPARHFADQAAWQAHLDALGIVGMKVHPDPVTVATEGALWGAVTARGIPFWDYLGSRLGTAVSQTVPSLPECVAARCQA